MLSSMDVFKTLNFYLNGHTIGTNYTSGYMSAILHIIFYCFVASNYDGWMTEDHVDETPYHQRTAFIFILLTLVFGNNLLSALFRIYFVYRKQNTKETHVFAVVVWAIQFGLFFAVMATAISYIWIYPVEVDTGVTSPLVRPLLLTAAIVIMVNHSIVAMSFLRATDAWSSKEYTEGFRGLTDEAVTDKQGKISERKGYVQNMLSAQIQAHAHKFTTQSDIAKVAPAVGILHSHADQSKMFGASTHAAKTLREYYNRLDTNKEGSALSNKIPDAESVVFLPNKKDLYVMDATQAAIMNLQSPLLQLNESKTRSTPLTQSMADFQLSGQTNAHMSLFQTFGTTMKVYIGVEDVWGFALGDALWNTMKNDVILPFSFFMYAFYLFFLFDNRSAASAWTITVFPALLASVSSKTGYFWDHFTASFFFGWCFILIAVLINTVDTDVTRLQWHIREPAIWNRVNLTQTDFANSTTDVDNSHSLSAATYLAVTLSLMGLVAGMRRHWLYRPKRGEEEKIAKEEKEEEEEIEREDRPGRERALRRAEDKTRQGSSGSSISMQ